MQEFNSILAASAQDTETKRTFHPDRGIQFVKSATKVMTRGAIQPMQPLQSNLLLQSRMPERPLANPQNDLSVCFILNITTMYHYDS
jgi:hypothetical protein